MNAIVQTVAVPENRLISLNFKLPPDFPAGFVDISFAPHEGSSSIDGMSSNASNAVNKEAIKADERKNKMLSIIDCLSASNVFIDDGVEYQRKIRSEWDDRDEDVKSSFIENIFGNDICQKNLF